MHGFVFVNPATCNTLKLSTLAIIPSLVITTVNYTSLGASRQLAPAVIASLHRGCMDAGVAAAAAATVRVSIKKVAIITLFSIPLPSLLLCLFALILCHYLQALFYFIFGYVICNKWINKQQRICVAIIMAIAILYDFVWLFIYFHLFYFLF